MFWGVTLESGKRYSQKVSESYHLSMACLEPLHGGTKPAEREVAVMLEHGESEYALCVLEYGRVMQVNLDIIFDCGEIVTYFLKGEGVVHLTGYALAETEDANEANDKINDILALNVDEEGEDDEADEDWIPSTLNVDEDDDEDWIPSKEIENSDTSDGEEEDSNSDGEPDVLTKIENDVDQNQLSETNEDEEADDAPRKRKIVSVKGNKAKKQKLNDSPPAENGGGISGKVKSKKKSNIEANHMNAEDSDNDMSDEEESEDNDSDDASAEDNNIDYSSEDQDEVSSVGNTPMPKKRVSSKTGLGESPDLPHRQKKQKTKLKAPNVSSPNKGSVRVTPKNARKLRGNVQVEDLRTGSGPLAKNGKFVSLSYVGKLSNGKVFESCEAPKKPFTFRLGKGDVIKGLDIGVEGMKVGGKRRITVPPNMGYGNQKIELIPPNSTLIFTVELKLVR